MSIRYQTEIKTMDNVQFQISIEDTDYTGSVNPLSVGLESEDGFTLNYNSSGNNRMSPILASEAVISCAVEDSSFETFISDLINAEEQRFFLIIKKLNTSTVTYEPYWIGPVIQDLIVKEDMPFPYVFQLHATDGITTLKTKTYSGTIGNTSTFLEILSDILSQIETTSFYDIGDVFFRTAIDWYNTKQFSTSPAQSLDPLDVTKVYDDVYIIEKEQNIFGFDNCYNILMKLLKRWGARIIMADGIFNIIQLNNYENNTIDIRNYNTSGNFLTVESWDHRILSFHREGHYEYMKALQKVSVTYKYRQSYYNGNLLPEQTHYVTPVSVGNIQGGSGERLIFSGNVIIEFNSGTPTIELHKWVFALRLQVGSYYLTNKNGYYEWTTVTTDRVRVESGLQHTVTHYVHSFSIGFITPDIPASGEGFFQFEFIEFEDPGGNTWTPPPGSTYSYECNSFTLNQYIDEAIEEGEIDFTAENDNSSGHVRKYSETVDLGEIETGDGPNTFSIGRLLVKLPSGVWENSDETWSIGGGGTGKNINQLLVRESLAGQIRPIETYTGTFSKISHAANTFRLNGYHYVLQQGSFIANTSKWEGIWFPIITDRTNIDDGWGIGGGGGGIRSVMNKMSPGNIGIEVRALDNTTRNTYSLPGVHTLISSNYTISEGDHVLYFGNLTSDVTLTLPNYDENENKAFKIINTDSTYSVTIQRASTSEKINGLTSDYVLTHDTSIELHNTGINDIGWATTYKASRK